MSASTLTAIVAACAALAGALAMAAWARARLGRLQRQLQALAGQMLRVEQGQLPQPVAPKGRPCALHQADAALQRLARARLDADALLLQQLARQEAELARRGQELARRNDDLASQGTELARRSAELSQALSRIDALTILDPLTGLPNRRRAEELLHAEIQRHRRTGGTLSLILGSIDRFQHLSDTLGPAESDEVVKAMAQRLASACRCTDFVSRYARDEFALLLPETGPEGAAVVARKLLLAASATPCRAAGGVTLSLGVLVKVESVGADAALSAARESLHRAQRRAPVNLAELGSPLTGLLPA